MPFCRRGISILEYLKKEANKAFTENGAASFASSGSDCLDLFATIGAMRLATDKEITSRFLRAYAENADLAMKLLFFARDVRGGLGERRAFRVILRWLADNERQTLQRNIPYIPEFGRYDDLLTLIDTPCEEDALALIGRQLQSDLDAFNKDQNVSLLAKWLPSVNASSAETVRLAKRLALSLGMDDATYRKTLSKLRVRIKIIENDLRRREYSFDYAKQPSRAMLKYRKAFMRNDSGRYQAYIDNVSKGQAVMHTGTLTPYDIIAPLFDMQILDEERKSIDAMWNAQTDHTGSESALVVIDGSGSMYHSRSKPLPAAVALSLGIYFAERNRGCFHNHFITFSQTPRLIEIKGKDISEKVRYYDSYREAANTSLENVFTLILEAAVRNHADQRDMPDRLYIVSDMEFDSCIENADASNFQNAKQRFAQYGYTLPEVVFWNVDSRSRHQPVTMNEQGVALVSGCSPKLFSMVTSGVLSPYSYMFQVLNSDRYAVITSDDCL